MGTGRVYAVRGRGAPEPPQGDAPVGSRCSPPSSIPGRGSEPLQDELRGVGRRGRNLEDACSLRFPNGLRQGKKPGDGNEGGKCKGCSLGRDCSSPAFACRTPPPPHRRHSAWASQSGWLSGYWGRGWALGRSGHHRTNARAQEWRGEGSGQATSERVADRALPAELQETPGACEVTLRKVLSQAPSPARCLSDH